MKKEFNLIFLSSILFIMVFTLFLETDISAKNVTGWVVKQEKEQPTIYEYLNLVKNYPENYNIVTGKYSKDYERQYAKKISDYFGVNLAKEEHVASNKNLILIGNPNTNLLLDKTIPESYSGDESFVSIEKDNLIVLASNKKQLEKIINMITDFQKNRAELSSPKTKISLYGALAWLIPAAILFAALIIFMIEKHRKINIREVSMEDKIHELENYIEKYKEQGHPDEQIREWLIQNGYDKELVQKCTQEVKDAGTAVSGKAD